MIIGAVLHIKTSILDEIVGTTDRHGLLGCRRCSALTRKIHEAGGEITRIGAQDAAKERFAP